jgi:Family of unknown function (DUF6492)
VNCTVGFYCKSYRADFAPLRQLLQSFDVHNPDGLRLTLSLPSTDIGAFEDFFGSKFDNVKLVTDESYCEHDLSQFPGWHAQQICKLMSWKVVDADHYVLLDSDCYFIRDVLATDLKPTNGARYLAYASFVRTVLTEDNTDLLKYIRGQLTIGPDRLPSRPNMLVDRLDEFLHYKGLPQDKPDAIERSSIPMKVFGRDRWLYCQPGQIFSSGLLKRLCQYFEEHGLTAGDAILICPWEYNWYGEYAATHGFADTEFRVSPFVHFQQKENLKFSRREKITVEQFRKRFCYVQMAAGHLSELQYHP